MELPPEYAKMGRAYEWSDSTPLSRLLIDAVAVCLCPPRSQNADDVFFWLTNGALTTQVGGVTARAGRREPADAGHDPLALQPRPHRHQAPGPLHASSVS